MTREVTCETHQIWGGEGGVSGGAIIYNYDHHCFINQTKLSWVEQDSTVTMNVQQNISSYEMAWLWKFVISKGDHLFINHIYTQLQTRSITKYLDI